MQSELGLGWKNAMVDFGQVADQKVNSWRKVNFCKKCKFRFFCVQWTMYALMNEWNGQLFEWNNYELNVKQTWLFNELHLKPNLIYEWINHL